MTNEDPRATTHRRQSTLPETWREFNRALRSPYEPFDPLTWLHRLCLGVMDHIYVGTGCSRVVHKYDLHKAWRPLIPVAGIFMVIVIAFAYFSSLRSVVQERWCCHFLLAEKNELWSKVVVESSSQDRHVCADCRWMNLHDFLVMYIFVMCLFHYVAACIRSPGVALPDDDTTTTKVVKWRAIDGQGGLIGLSPVYHLAEERRRVTLYGPLEEPRKEEDTKGVSHSSCFYYFPTPEATFCERCRILRPPRCRHCHTCNRCILQYDHHCIWINNCVGYNNYRHFVLMLFFLTLGCWYGMCMLFYPFYLPFLQLIREHGWNNGLISGGAAHFINPPAPHHLIYQVCTGTMKVQTVLNLVYPILFALGWILSGFMAFHVFYILHARTTLEHNIVLEGTIPFMLRESGRPANTPVVNPYDLGYMRNLKQIFGPFPLLIFVPLIIEPMPPVIPKIEKTI